MTEPTGENLPSGEAEGAAEAERQPPAPPGPPADSQSVRLGLLILGTIACTWWLGPWGLAVIFGLVVMITLHELGHYVMAKRAGMKVTEFFLGFGPRIWSFRRGETEYGLKALPLGAYVKIIGMSSAEEVDPADESRTYRSKPFWQRFGVAVAGSTMHGIQALVIVFVLLVFVGMPGGTVLRPTLEPTGWTIGALVPGCPAAEAGLRPGDRLLTMNGDPVQDWVYLTSQVESRAGKKVTFEVERDGQVREVTLRVAAREVHGVPMGALGVSPDIDPLPNERVGLLEAVPQTFSEVGGTLAESIKSLGWFARPSTIKDFGSQVVNASSNRDKIEDAQRARELTSTSSLPDASTDDGGKGQRPADGSDNATTDSDKACAAAMAAGSAGDTGDPKARLTSIVGIFQIGKFAGQMDGFRGILSLLAGVNIFIGLFNLLPLPILDGGHVVVAVYEKFQERRLGLKTRYLADLTKAAPVFYVFAVMLGLLAVSTLYLDLVNPLVN